MGAQYDPRTGRLYESFPAQSGEGHMIRWVSEDGTAKGMIGGLYSSEAFADATIDWYIKGEIGRPYPGPKK